MPLPHMRGAAESQTTQLDPLRDYTEEDQQKLRAEGERLSHALDAKIYSALQGQSVLNPPKAEPEGTWRDRPPLL